MCVNHYIKTNVHIISIYPQLSVQIVKQYNIGNAYNRPLIMFQAPVFFEPYLRVHNYLSTCSTEKFPMGRYIVDGQVS